MLRWHWCGFTRAGGVPPGNTRRTHKGIFLRLGRLSSSSIAVQEITMNKRLPVARYFVIWVCLPTNKLRHNPGNETCPILAGWHQILPFPRRSNPGSPSLSLLQPCCSSFSASGRAPRLPIVSARVPHVQLSNTCLSPSWGHPGGFPPPTWALQGSPSIQSVGLDPDIHC